ncbi:unnamed protein product [Bursaphelenchus xylophilus]|uniref:(pine wood nematode) hypothetical protein n=1 Tax=Bursaphelenchus xylophilus TaxID=6326 RepID=A0A1I7RQ52_BURXY|nr:unnamed protein product [Bursaphelenchus xylophilus]CAG9097174.1 unnamed protein product [Bursaphelenchus xylophilus]
MCTSLILKPLLIFGISAAVALTAVSLFTPGWSTYKDDTNKTVHVGIITYNCGKNNATSLTTACKNYIDSRPKWEKAVIALMFIALIIELVILIWSVFSCLAFCLPSCFPLITILAGLATACLVAAIAVYGSKNKNSTTALSDLNLTTNVTKDWDQLLNLSYSFWLAVAAAVVMAVSTLLAAVTSLISVVVPF